jgi:hypothetical protein
MATIEKRVRNGRVTYRARYRDPAGMQRSKPGSTVVRFVGVVVVVVVVRARGWSC